MDVAGDEREDLVGNAVQVLGLGFLAENGQAGLELRDLDVRDQAPLEATAQAVLEGGDGFRGTVGRDDDLAVLVVELVERMEELLLELLGPLEELDVVDQEDVEVAVAALERRHRLGADGIDELVHEGLGGHVADALVPEDGFHVMADGVEEMGLPEAGGAVDEERVVGTGGRLGDRQGRGVGEAVRGADHELVEGVAGIETPGRPEARGLLVGRGRR